MLFLTTDRCKNKPGISNLRIDKLSGSLSGREDGDKKITNLHI